MLTSLFDFAKSTCLYSLNAVNALIGNFNLYLFIAVYGLLWVRPLFINKSHLLKQDQLYVRTSFGKYVNFHVLYFDYDPFYFLCLFEYYTCTSFYIYVSANRIILSSLLADATDLNINSLFFVGVSYVIYIVKLCNYAIPT